MPSPQIRTFQQCLKMAENEGGNRHLMLGNGFSVALFPRIFNYRMLAERVTSQQIKQIFASLETNDFEYVMRKLTDALHISRLYDEGAAFGVCLSQDLEELKTTLINVITQSHPASPQAIRADQYESCHAFLSHFNNGKKYTFNYDLLLYWVYMHFLEDEDSTKRLKCDDGFRHPENDQSIVTWEIGREHDQNLYYLHGAMHVFSDGSGIEKYTWVNDGKGRTITQQVQHSINQQKYPVFISEGTTQHKLSRIRDNSYLGRAFSSLKSIRGNLFIFGHSLRDEDNHVFDYVNSKSGVSNIFISVFGESENNQVIFDKVARWQDAHPSRNYHFYTAESVNVWGNQ